MCSRSPLWRAVDFCKFDGSWPIHVARVWPPRKRDFLKSQAGLRDDAAMTSFAARNTQWEPRMAEFKADVLILGAGMVGVGAALHLQRRGRDVILVDRRPLAGEETSFGN